MRREDIDNWKGVIEEKEFNWKHYLDLGGRETKKMNIASYATTFLIDNKGKVLEKNIDVDKLEKYLEESTNGLD